jgi:hypothetical protein
MNREQRAEFVTPAPAQKTLGLRGIEIKRARIDIGKHRARAGSRDGAGRGEKAERRGENLISGLHSSGQQSQPQGVSAGSTTDGFLRAAEFPQLALERLDLGAQDVMLRSAHSLDGCQHFGANPLILPLQIQHRHCVKRPRAWRRSVRRIGKFGLGEGLVHGKRNCSRRSPPRWALTGISSIRFSSFGRSSERLETVNQEAWKLASGFEISRCSHTNFHSQLP